MTGPGWGGEEGVADTHSGALCARGPLLCPQRAPLVGDSNSNTSARSNPGPEADVFDGIAVKNGVFGLFDADQAADITDR